MMSNIKPLICKYCKKMIDVDKECIEEHEGNFYHADCKK
jgi:hypothetical protein